MNPAHTDLELTDQQVHDLAVTRLSEQLPLDVTGYACTTTMILDVLIKAAVTGRTIEAVCKDLERVADSNTIRAYLNEQLEAGELLTLERHVNQALVQDIPQRVFTKAREIAIDLHDEPFYGHSPELRAFACRGEAQRGTTYFFRVATAYVLVNDLRVTLAVLFVRPEDDLSEILDGLLRRVRILEVAIQRLLLDKGFCSIPICRALHTKGLPAIIACPIRGKQGGTRALCQGAKSYRTQHTFRSAPHGTLTVEVAVVRTYTTAKRSKKGKRRVQWLVYVVLHEPHVSPRQVRRVYRRRFGVETSYRCMRQVRAWTTSRNPALRFLLLGLAFILVNLWVILRWHYTQVPRRGGRQLNPTQFELQRLANFLNRAIEAKYGVVSSIRALAPPLGV